MSVFPATSIFTAIHFSNALPEPDEDEISKALLGDAALISQALGHCLPPLENVDKPVNPFDTSSGNFLLLDLGELAKLQFAHQTKQATSGVRTIVAPRTQK